MPRCVVFALKLAIAVRLSAGNMTTMTVAVVRNPAVVGQILSVKW
ncbi:MAG TPA: hypothetical protein V6D16_23410 [Candidatus Obscuribacterales bacterium]